MTSYFRDSSVCIFNIWTKNPCIHSVGLNLVRVSMQTDKEVKKKHTPETCHHTQSTTQVFPVRANDKKHPHNAACVTWTKYVTMNQFFSNQALAPSDGKIQHQMSWGRGCITPCNNSSLFMSCCVFHLSFSFFCSTMSADDKKDPPPYLIPGKPWHTMLTNTVINSV